ncbi:MAG: STAS domain-containing protein, partial [Nitrospirota bacterium]
ELTVQNASALQGIFIRTLESSSNLSINLKDIAEIDLSFLQLLCSVSKTSADLNKGLTLSGPCPEVFREAVRSAGFIKRTGCVLDCKENCLGAEMGKDPAKERN